MINKEMKFTITNKFVGATRAWGTGIPLKVKGWINFTAEELAQYENKYIDAEIVLKITKVSEEEKNGKGSTNNKEELHTESNASRQGSSRGLCDDGEQKTDKKFASIKDTSGVEQGEALRVTNSSESSDGIKEAIVQNNRRKPQNRSNKKVSKSQPRKKD
jgi:hypothetical protein